MENSLHSKKKIPNYVLVSIAVVQSEIFWFYSVLYYIFRESGLVIDSDNTVTKTAARSRSYSAPPTSKAFTRIDFVTLDDVIEEDEEERIQFQRRYSLPSEGIIKFRERPSKEDELSGTTCPPVIWQKIRVKLGRPPVHGDPKPKAMSSISPTPSPSPPSFKSSPPSINLKRTDSASPSIPTKSTTDTLYSLSEVSSSSSLLSTKSSFSSLTIEEPSIISTGTQQKKLTQIRIISKINSAFRMRKSRSSSDLSKTKTL
ncbi:unnamed protein product [Mucor hiemalis]